MLTEFILGLLSSLCFVGCGVQFRFESPWISNPLVEFHAGSWLLLCFVDCVMLPSFTMNLGYCGLLEFDLSFV